MNISLNYKKIALQWVRLRVHVVLWKDEDYQWDTDSQL